MIFAVAQLLVMSHMPLFATVICFDSLVLLDLDTTGSALIAVDVIRIGNIASIKSIHCRLHSIQFNSILF